MAISALLKSIYRAVNSGVDGKLSLACEIYEPGILPGVDGFDPADALAGFCGTSIPAWEGYRGLTYHRLIKKWGDINRSDGTQFSSVSLTISNVDKFISALALAQPLQSLEGYQIVIRILSRNQSVDLDDSDVRFCGRIEKPGDVSREDFPLSAKEHMGTIDVQLPRRKFTATDLEGRAVSDPEFEGFPFVPTTGSNTVNGRERRTDILGLFGLKKTVSKTIPWSSHSAADANRAVRNVFGRSQVQGVHVGFADVGNSIPMLTVWADGKPNGIQGWENLRKISPGFTELVTLDAAPTFRYGLRGGVGAGTQQPVLVPSAADLIGNHYYSYAAWTYTFVNGSQLDQDDPAPDLAAVILGSKIPLPDASGVFNQIGFSDNPAYIARFILTDSSFMNIDPAFIDDEVCFATGQWCDQYIEDYTQTDTFMWPDDTTLTAGVDFHIYKASSTVTPDHFKYALGDSVNPWIQEVEYQLFAPENPAPTPGDPYPIPEPTPQPDPSTPRFFIRRRYTCNVNVEEVQKAIDFLNNVVFAAAALKASQGANGKIQIRVRKPVDFCLVRQDTLAGVTEIPVDSVLPWVNSLDGKLYIGANLTTSEIRIPTGWRYTTAGNSITLAKTGNVTISGATFSGGNNTTTPASATLTFTGGGAITVTIDGISLTHNAFGSDTTGTLAGWFAAAINAHPTLGRYIKATWDTGTPTVVTLTAKIGFLQFATALVNAHPAAEEVLRIKASFSTEASAAAGLTRSNVLDNSFKWSIGGRQSSFNVVELSYYDSSQDWRRTTIRIPNDPHISQVKKRLIKEIDGAAIDNYSQAVRRANQILAEERDCGLSAQHGSDGEALLVEEGDVICNNTSDFPNLPILVEGTTLKSDLAVHFSGRRYLNSIFSDTAEQRTVPIPTLLTYTNLPPPVADNLVLTETITRGADGLLQTRVRGEFDFGEYAGPQLARIKVKFDGESVFRDTNEVARPDDDNHGVFEFLAPIGEHEVSVITENRYGDKSTAVTETITIEEPTLPEGPIVLFTQTGSLRRYTLGIVDYTEFEKTYIAGYQVRVVPSNYVIYTGPDESFTIDLNDFPSKASTTTDHETRTYDRFGNFGTWTGYDYNDVGEEPAPEDTTTISIDISLSTPCIVVLHLIDDDDVAENVAFTRVQMRAPGESWPTVSGHNVDGQVTYRGLNRDPLIPKLIDNQIVEIRVGIETFKGDIFYTDLVVHRFEGYIIHTELDVDLTQLDGGAGTVAANTTEEISFTYPGIKLQDGVKITPQTNVVKGVMVDGRVDAPNSLTFRIANVTGSTKTFLAAQKFNFDIFVHPLPRFSRAGLKLWLMADAIGGLADGASIQTWNDGSGQGNDLTQATSGKRPLYKTNIVNGLPVVRFDGIDDFLAIAFAASIAPPFTLVIVAKLRSAWSAGNNAIADGGGGLNNYLFRATNNTSLYLNRVISTQIGPATVTTNSWMYISAVVNGASSSLRGNGGTAATGTLSGVNLTGFRLGSRDDDAEHGDVDIAEVLLRTGTSYTDMQDYVKAKYGL